MCVSNQTFKFSKIFDLLECKRIIRVGTGGGSLLLWLFVAIAHEVQVHHVVEGGIEVIAEHIGFIIACAGKCLKISLFFFQFMHLLFIFKHVRSLRTCWFI